jgi:CheY-like chemotaxis protein
MKSDVVLCDLGLPGMNGFDVARAFRTEPGLSGAFLIALSGYAQPKDVAKAKETGFDAHLSKPYRVEALLKLIESPPPTP